MSDQPLRDTEIADLRCLAGMIIPASAKYGVPGADDAAIFADVLRSLGRDCDDVRVALALCAERAGGPLSGLDASARAILSETLQAEPSSALAVLTRLVMLCYYRDDRVVLSLGLEPRPPFPNGHVVEQGDWSLLDPVRARPPFWRKAP
jgi:hypothetical protein